MQKIFSKCLTRAVWSNGERKLFTMIENLTQESLFKCIEKTYKRYRVPQKGASRVFSSIEYQQVREVDAKRKTLSIDFTLTMRWLDSRIKRSRFSEENKNEEIFLGPNAIDQIWIPNFRIVNRTSFKPKDEWYSIVSAGILGEDETETRLSCFSVSHSSRQIGFLGLFEVFRLNFVRRETVQNKERRN